MCFPAVSRKPNCSIWACLWQFCTFLPWALTPPPVQKFKQVVIVDLGFLFGVRKNQGVGRKGTKRTPNTRVQPWSCICLECSVCLFSAQRVSGVFMFLSGLGHDTDAEKNNCLNPNLLNSRRLFQKNNPSRKERFVWHQAAEVSSGQALCSGWTC